MRELLATERGATALTPAQSKYAARLLAMNLLLVRIGDLLVIRNNHSHHTRRLRE
jgi:hypothetical protein